jgi:hypothetical protein
VLSEEQRREWQMLLLQLKHEGLLSSEADTKRKVETNPW